VKDLQKKKILETELKKVSIPLRGIGSERRAKKTHHSEQFQLFPSPCGELVVKVALVGFGLFVPPAVSIPLRGIGSESLPQPRRDRKQFQPSNPLRSFFDPKI
jgi:hypothetical protein